MKNKYKHISIMMLLMMFVLTLSAQSVSDSTSNETIVKEKKGSIFAGKPGKSLVMSLIIPGAGQIYNKSYLRVPFVYAAVGGMGYVMVTRVKQYHCLDAAYKASIDQVPFEPTDKSQFCMDVMNIHDPNQLRILRDQANNNRQLAIIGFALVWLAQGIDAYVDAHLKDFNISDDLSFKLGAKSSRDAYAPMNVGLYVSF